MCTVTFVPIAANDFILTSNRDEAPARNTIPPKMYTVDKTKLIFPKDEVAGGTWIGMSERKRLICLLNGGFTSHQRKENYRMSRGVIVTTLLTSINAVEAIKTYDFEGIEPFTIILVTWDAEVQLYELVWDGVNVHFSEKPITPHIWSSSLLYADNVKKLREHWFSDFLTETRAPLGEEMLKFHKTAGEGNPETDLIMDRGFVKTKSITLFVKDRDQGVMRYEDLQTREITTIAS